MSSSVENFVFTSLHPFTASIICFLVLGRCAGPASASCSIHYQVSICFGEGVGEGGYAGEVMTLNKVLAAKESSTLYTGYRGTLSKGRYTHTTFIFISNKGRLPASGMGSNGR